METRSAEDIEASTERLLNDLKAVVHDGEELLRVSIQDLAKREWPRVKGWRRPWKSPGIRVANCKSGQPQARRRLIGPFVSIRMNRLGLLLGRDVAGYLLNRK